MRWISVSYSNIFNILKPGDILTDSTGNIYKVHVESIKFTGREMYPGPWVLIAQQNNAKSRNIIQRFNRGKNSTLGVYDGS
jgi:hypothetical protein